MTGRLAGFTRTRSNVRLVRPRWILICLVLMPVMAHGVGVSVAIYRGSFYFGTLDRMILVAVLGYLLISVAVGLHRRYLPQYVLVVLSGILGLVLAEVVLQIVSPRTQPNYPWQPGLHNAVAEDSIQGISGPIRVSINSLGLRGPEVRLEDMDLRILCVGGSTTECLNIDDQLSWPWLLQDMLTAQLNKKVFIGNAGRSGHSTLNHNYLLLKYPEVSRFDWVFIMCGINDAGRLLRDNYEQLAREVSSRTLAPSFRNNVYYRCFRLTQYLSLMIQTKPGSVAQDLGGAWILRERRNRRLALKKRTYDEPPKNLARAVERYRSDLREIILTCRKIGVRPLMITQPTLWHEGLSEDLEELLMQHTPDGAHTPEALEPVISAFNEALCEVCLEEGVDYVDLDSMLPKDSSVFVDDAHFNVSGCEKVAAALYDRFVVKLDEPLRLSF